MIYFDNSATTNPKPASVINATVNAMKKYSFNSGRGGYAESVSTAEHIYNTREKIAAFTGFEPQNVAFTQNCTLALNMAIKGVAENGDHFIISSLEHNAVARPIESLRKRGIITYDIAKYSFNEEETVNNFKSLIRSNTKAIVCTMASNVFGCSLPIKRLAELAVQNGLIMIVDGAQGVGVFDVNGERDKLDILCCAGHKGLYGPMGTGFVAVGNDIELDTVIEGGTGSASFDMAQPDFYPDRLESGTLNNGGIIGLGAGVDFVKRKGVDRIHRYELSLIKYMFNELSKNDRVTLYTDLSENYNCAPILSFNLDDYPSEKTAQLLAKKGICVRGGLHCAPLAHNSFGTSERGTVRISPSVFSTQRECEIFLNYLKKL